LFPRPGPVNSNQDFGQGACVVQNIFPWMCELVLTGSADPGWICCPLLSSLAGVVAGYLFTFYNSKLSKEREALIDFLNEQVMCF
jgi:hypothetical protein